MTPADVRIRSLVVGGVRTRCYTRCYTAEARMAGYGASNVRVSSWNGNG
ncbi:hypothetical protein GCM10022255_006400 [Dactylosporangium darangshiense]|uniref:Uncharacterized protein n=1 Tax=Dactylosporangium darangshiense TaxID=579108 RepID=A0ABP8CWE5_9ACTN